MTQNDNVATELSFGQKAVGVTFNPAGDEKVTKIKNTCAAAIDQLDDFRNTEGTSSNAKRHASIAITELESACMRAVKALTWKD